MTAVQRSGPDAAVPLSDEARHAALDGAVAKLEHEGWMLETRPDYERVLIGHNDFRRLVVQRKWGIGHRRELVEVDEFGDVSLLPV